MNPRNLLRIFIPALVLAGCVQSLHPLYTDNDRTFEPKLIGTWKGEGDNLWIFLRHGDKSYELIYTEKGSPAKFEANLVKLGQALFLDLFPQSPDLKNDLQQAHLLNVHTFSRVWIEDDTLRLAMLEHDWLKTMIDSGKVNIQHEVLDRQVVLTAPTKELQQFVVRHANDKGAFPRPKDGMARLQ